MCVCRAHACTRCPQVYRELVESGNHRFLLDPNSDWMRNFDILSTSALAFTALVTPVEVRLGCSLSCTLSLSTAGGRDERALPDARNISPVAHPPPPTR